MMRTNVRESSIDAYAHLKASHGLSDLQRRIVDFIAKRPGCDFTRRELESGTGIDRCSVAGRVNELMKAGVLKEAARRRCTITRIHVRPVELVQAHLPGVGRG